MSVVAHPLALLLALLTLPLLDKTESTVSCSCNVRHVHKSNRGSKRLNSFLRDVLDAREHLSWIDEIADELRSNKVYRTRPELRDKIDVMFFNNERGVWDTLANENQNEICKRHKRNSQRTADSRLKRERSAAAVLQQQSAADTSSDFNSQKQRVYENAPLYGQNFNSGTRDEQEERMKNAIPTTADPLEKVLQSINVFPVAADPYQVEMLPAKDDAAKSDFQIEVGRLNAMSASSAAAINNDTFNGEHLRLGRSLLAASPGADLRSKSFTKLFTADHEADQSQTTRALSGDLAAEIVNAIFDKVKGNEKLNLPNGFKLHHNAKPVESIASDNMNQLESKSGETDSHAEPIAKKITDFVKNLISSEVEKQACVPLPPDTNEFLQWLVETEDVDDVKNEVFNSNNKNLEDDSSDNDSILNLTELRRKSKILQALLDKYEGLSSKEKSKVQAIHEYLVTRLEFVQTYIDALKSQLGIQDKHFDIHT